MFGQKDGTVSLIEHSAQFVLNMAHFNLQPSSAGKRFWSHVPQRETTNVHDSGQVCTFPGKNGPGFEALTQVLASDLHLSQIESQVPQI